MGTRKNNKKSKKFRKNKKTRSKRQRGGVRNINEELIDASAVGNDEIVKVLLTKIGIEVNALDGQGKPALYWASFNGHAETVKMLLDKGANIEAKDIYGRTALILASIYGHKETVDMLLDKGADVNAKDNGGRTALVWACQNSYNIDPTNPDYNDILKKRIDIVQNLLTYGANVNQNVMGMTLLQRAKENNHKKTVTVLEQHIKFKNLLDTLTENTENNENVFSKRLSKRALDNLTNEQRELFTEFAARNSWNINYDTGELVPYSHGTRGGKRKTIKSKKSKRKTRKTRRK